MFDARLSGERYDASHSGIKGVRLQGMAIIEGLFKVKLQKPESSEETKSIVIHMNG